VYTNGSSERFVGEFIKDHRQSIVLATKYSNAMPGNDPNAAGNHRKSMMQAVDASLSRLQTDYIDLYWVHIWDQMTPVEEVIRGLDDLVRSGQDYLRRRFGRASMVGPQANTLADLRGWSRFVGLQIEYSLIQRTVERELIPMANALDLGVLAWSPLANGVLTGKHHANGNAEAGRMARQEMQEFIPEQARTQQIITALKSVAEQTGRSMAQVALAWLRNRPLPVIPILGARKVSQLQDNLASLELDLSAEQVKSLDGASSIEMGFPYYLYAAQMTRALMYGGMRDSIIA
jgi:aryl-alcohol dehydrogenase-like predicted oxidoreductase